MQNHIKSSIFTLLAIAGAASPALAGDISVFRASGASAADIQSEVDAFRADLGDLNAPNPGSVGSGRREVNWDGAPDSVSTPNSFPGDFFNADTFPRARGIEFSTPGSDLQLSANAASGVGIEFGNISPFFSSQFEAFSAERLFSPLGSNVTEVEFYIPGTEQHAVSRGLGVVFTDVDIPETTTIELFDARGESLGVWAASAPIGNENFSFLAISFDEAIIARAKITTGQAAIDAIVEEADQVVMDDFIFGEPVESDIAIPEVFSDAGTSAAAIIDTVDAFREELGDLNAPNPGSVGSGRREINWDGAPDGVSAPNTFPADFFNAPTFPRARGVEFWTPGTGFMLSATQASGEGILFSNIQLELPSIFSAFSPERLFTPLGSTETYVNFFVPGTDEPALTRGFGAVFSDVSLDGSASLELFDAQGESLGVWDAQPSSLQSFSFVGVAFDEPIVAQAKIISGVIPIDNPTLGDDLVVLDDFIYAEPVPFVQQDCLADLNGDGNLNFFDVSAFLSAFNNMDPAVDFNGDGSFNYFDVSQFLISFSAGCP